MRTTLVIPAELLDEAREILQFKSKTNTIIFALRELIRRRRIDDLKSLMGSVELHVNVPASRRRPKPSLKTLKDAKRRR
jgi:hypothetical protein